MEIFYTNADVLVLYVLTLMCFSDWYAGSFRYKYWSRSDKPFQATASRIPGMAPWWAFSLLWFFVYALIIAAMFLFYRGNTTTGTTFDAVGLLFLFNMLLNKAWTRLFVNMRMAGASLIVMLFCLFTAIGIAFLFGWSNWWTQFWLFLWYPIWLLYPLYLNAAWLYYERPHKGLKGLLPVVGDCPQAL